MSLNFKNWSLTSKITSFGLLLTFNLFVVGTVGFKDVGDLSESLDDISNVQFPAVRTMTLLDMMHDGLRGNALQSIIVSGSKNKAEIEDARKEFQEFSTNIKTYIQTLDKLPIREETHKAIQKAMPEVTSYVVYAQQVVDMALSGATEKALKLLPKLNTQFKRLETELETLGDLIEKDATQSRENSDHVARDGARLMVIAVALGAIISIFLSLLMARTIAATLRKVSAELRAEANAVLDSSENIASASQNLAQSSTEQAAALQETASSMEEITAMVKKSSENAKNSSDLAHSGQEQANRGKGISDQLLNAMGQISTSNTQILAQVEASNKEITDIVRVIQDIGEKTKVINDIVFQTKLLSFNASVEAARAGEHGKGFAVVAEEVGNLAQMSGNAAKEISEKLGGSIQKVESIVQNTKQSVERLVQAGRSTVETGIQTAKDCAAILTEVARSISNVAVMSNEITTATHEQTQGIQEINRAMNQLDQVTHENAATSQQSASAAQQLSTRSRQLMGVVGSIDDLINGKSSRTEPPAHVQPPGNVVRIADAKNARVAAKVPKENPAPLATTPALKKASGSDIIPDESDPRFKDV